MWDDGDRQRCDTTEGRVDVLHIGEETRESFEALGEICWVLHLAPILDAGYDPTILPYPGMFGLPSSGPGSPSGVEATFRRRSAPDIVHLHVQRLIETTLDA